MLQKMLSALFSRDKKNFNLGRIEPQFNELPRAPSLEDQIQKEFAPSVQTHRLNDAFITSALSQARD